MQRILLVLVQATLIVLALILLIIVIVDPEYNKIGGVIASLTLPFLPNIIRRVLAAELSFRLQITYFIFLFAALFLGINFDFYRTVPHFDKVIHFFSGMISIAVAWFVLKFFKADKTSKPFQAIFIICFCITLSIIWEFFEFTCDKLLGQNMQQLISEGVDDTMFDLLFALIGTSVGTILFMRYTRQIESFFLIPHRKPK